MPKSAEYRRYLSLLGLSADAPSMEFLRRIVRAHLSRIPFENISKLYYWKTMGLHASMDLTQYLNGIGLFQFGGTCYSTNYHLFGLLRHLGFSVRLCGADMQRPDVHIVNIVTIDRREYIVDVGYAAPFLEPMPRDLVHDFVVTADSSRYVLSPADHLGRSQVTLTRNGRPVHGYRVTPAPRSIEEFAPVIADSFNPRATFMNALLLAKYGEDSSHVVHNMTYVASWPSPPTGRILRTRKEMNSMAELIVTIEEVFGIPAAVSTVALTNLSLTQDAWS